MRTKLAQLVSVLLFVTASFPARAVEPPVDCNCLTNLPGLQVTCPGYVPDLCALATNCFTTNMLAGSCTQNFPPGMQLPVGTYSLGLQVMDLQSNVFNCPVTFTVDPPVPMTNLTVVCPTNKTVECGSTWYFDPPIILSSCCGVSTTSSDTVVSNSPCSQSITRTWQMTDGCGNVEVCQQKVTLVDTTPPGLQCNGINLVPNGDFEFATNCPSAISQFDFATPWFTPTDATTDYYNSCAGVGSFVTTPTNTAGYQIPQSGQAYAGAVLYTANGTNPTNSYREYLEVPLLTSLTPGQKYLVSFYVSRAETFGLAVADISAKFMPLAYVNYGPPSNLYSGVLMFPLPPEINNPATNVIVDSTNWTLIQGLYTAIGWESHLILGNFKDDPSSAGAFVGGDFNDYAYYYFDNVSIVAVCDTNLTNITAQCGQPWDFPPFPIVDNCSGGNITVSNYTSTNNFCPLIVERTWYLEDQCGNTNLLTQTVTVVDTNPPILLCTGGGNLVPNPQFENYSFCPYYFGQVSAAAPWFNPTIATPDYQNACSMFPPVDAPNNHVGSQTPFSGNGYMGAFVYSVYGTNPVPGYREYIEAPLLSPLQAGTTYQVSFRVSLADFSGWAISQIGAHFSVGPVSASTQGPLSVTPQFENPGANLLTSTNGWMLVQGTFVATGGENHITLGNFRNDANTTATNAWGTNHSYYYFDDISVVPLCTFTNKTVLCGTAWDFDVPLAYDECSGDYLSIFVTSTTTTGTCPKVNTRVWTIYDACVNSMTVTQTVYEVDTVPPMLLCSGVNLIPNPGFEDMTQCANGPSWLEIAKPWFMPTIGSSDLFNPCADPSSGVDVPVNLFGTQTPFAGSSYGGGYVYAPGGATTNSYREYLATPLIAPLIAGQAYAVSFRVSRADNVPWAIAEIGAHFSTGPLTNWPLSYLAVTPQVVNPSANIITSATNWTLISGVFTASGGESYITLGNFFTDANTTAAFTSGSLVNAGYYYYDEVSVVAVCTNLTNKLVACGSPAVFDAPIGIDRCTGSNVTVAVVGNVTNSICPRSVTRTWSLTDQCGNSTNWSQTVTATNAASLLVNCACLEDSVLGLLNTNACSAALPSLSLLTNSPCITGGCGPRTIGQSPPAGTIFGGGSHPITLTISDCSGNTNVCVVLFNVTAPAPTITCPAPIIVTGCSNNTAIVNYTATATGNVGPIVYSPPSGSIFPLGMTMVSCTATSSCGGVAVCNFPVIVKAPHPKWGCPKIAIGVITTPMGTALINYLPDLPSGSQGVNFENIGSSGQDGVQFDLGPAESFSFTTVLDFNAPPGANFKLALPPAPGQTTGTDLLKFTWSCQPNCTWNISMDSSINSDPGSTFRSIAVSQEGELFPSFTSDVASLDTNVIASLIPMYGATSAVVRVEIDLMTREMVLVVPRCEWTPDNGRKGWDGCIYGNGTPSKGTRTNKTARLILTPPPIGPTPPITTLDLLASHMPSVPFRDPTIGAARRKWGDGHVTLMKAYDDGEARGMEFFTLGSGGGVNTDLGYASGFEFRVHHFETGDIPNQDEIYSMRGWPPGTTTNRPPPPVIDLRLAPNPNGMGTDVSMDLTDWGVSDVTLQLWDGTTLVAETNHVPVTPGSALATLSVGPRKIRCPPGYFFSLVYTNPVVVTGGLECTSGLGCVGTELRIIPEFTPQSSPPLAYASLECIVGEGMNNLVYDFQRTPGCVPVPLQVAASEDGVTLSWEGEGFQLQGAESVTGPWYDLGVFSPAEIPASAKSRVFRLRCE